MSGPTSGKQLKVLFLAAEAVPFAKVGGLADVAGSLPKAVRALGHDVRLMIPRYGTIRSSDFQLKRVGDAFPVPMGPGEEHVHLTTTNAPGGVPAYLIWNEHYFSSRDRVYGFEDDAQRFALFGRAALSALKVLDWMPDVIHANDWHTGIVPAWLSTAGRNAPFYSDAACLFSIHNLAYQGVSGRLILTFAQMENLEHLDVEQPGTVNWMAQGIAHADLVSTVSPGYAKEIMTPAIGMGLDPLLRRRRERLEGVLNGIDYDEWNPSTDPHIPHRFDVETLERRVGNKTVLQQQARLPARPDVPLVAVVSRLDEVKGIGLLEPVIDWLLSGDAQFVLLGTGAPEYHEMLERAQSRHPEQMRAFLRFDDVLARRIYAGADMLLMPSAVEPCGLGQMIAMRYGCVPVVHATGGLADTVVNYCAKKRKGTGFTFQAYTSTACRRALQRALKAYAAEKAWHSIQQQAMKVDHSWDASAQVYVDLYRQAVKLHAAELEQP
jgi:starch synthase